MEILNIFWVIRIHSLFSNFILKQCTWFYVVIVCSNSRILEDSFWILKTILGDWNLMLYNYYGNRIIILCFPHYLFSMKFLNALFSLKDKYIQLLILNYVKNVWLTSCLYWFNFIFLFYWLISDYIYVLQLSRLKLCGILEKLSFTHFIRVILLINNLIRIGIIYLKKW